MHDLDELWKDVRDTREIVENLVEKLGYKISHYEENAVVTPEEEAEQSKRFQESIERMKKRLPQGRKTTLKPSDLFD